MPRSFQFPLPGPRSNSEPADLWVPMAFTSSELQGRGNNYNNNVIARLRPGVSLEQARTEVKTIAEQIRQNYPPPLVQVFQGAELNTSVISLHEEVVGPIRILLLVLLHAVGLVLLIACANLANLLLARVLGRQKEIAIRMALGAGRLRLVRQLLSESLLLALAGGTLGLLVAFWAKDLLVALSPDNMPRTQEVHIDTSVLGFTLLVSLLTPVIFGLVPALETANIDFQANLKESSRSTTAAPGRRRLQGVFAVSQVALALVLLIGSGLLLRSFARLLQTDPGFRAERVLTLFLPLPAQTYQKAEQIRSFYQSLLERIASLPGVHRVGAASELPLAGQSSMSVQIEGQPILSEARPPLVSSSWVSGNYFETLGIPVKRGRTFSKYDSRNQPGVVVISESVRQRFWPGQEPIGKRMRWGGPDVPWLSVVGVVGNVKQGPLHSEAQPHLYIPYFQADDWLIEDMLRSLNLVVAAERDLTSLIAAIRNEVRLLDAELAVANIQTMEQAIHKSVAPQRFNTFVLAVFAVVALFLAAIGIYGLLAYTVAQRTHEIGIRMALGAQRRNVLKLVMGGGLKLVLIGLGLGLIGALALTRVLSSFLFGVTATDPVTFAGVSLFLTAVALLACYLPARRATKVDPMVALRYE